MNTTVFLVIFLGLPFLVTTIVELLNISTFKTTIPKEFASVYNKANYNKSQSYHREKTIFEIIESAFSVSVLLIFTLSGGFNAIDNFAESLTHAPITQGLIFIATVVLMSQALAIPFSLYETFVIEEKYGFNKSTIRIFLSDLFKSLLLLCILGGVILTALLWFFTTFTQIAWLSAWIFVSTFQLLILFIAPVVIMPLFNKFTPLPEGSLKKAIMQYAQKQRFKVGGIFTMDGSKRSTKANAYFTGFGTFRRIVLFDTLLKNHTTDELVSILAHEVGHYKRRHIIKLLTVSIIFTGMSFYLLSLVINNPFIFAVFKVDSISMHAGLLFAGILASPLFKVIGIATNALSRKFEYEPDEFAVTTYPNHEAFITALKKLSVDNLSNLFPHPVKVIFDYTHPPVVNRINAIRARRKLSS